MSKPSIPMVIAHRGASGYAPENTLAAFTQAAQLGIQMVEFDVMLAHCGTPVVFHDTDLQRTTQTFGKIHNKTYEQLAKLDAGSWFSKKFSDQHVLSLEELLPVLAQLNLAANIELKPRAKHEKALVEAVLTVLNSAEVSILPPLFSSFSLPTMDALRNVGAQLHLGMLMHEWSDDIINKAVELDCVSIHLNADIVSADRVNLLKNQGFWVLTYTVNNPAQASEFFKYGIDAVFSDYPDKIAAVL